MKRILSILIGLAIPVVVLAEGPRIVKFDSSACETNASAVTTYTLSTDQIISGWVDTIIVDQTGTGTGTISIVTLASQGTGAARTILSDTSQSADASYPVRDIVCTTAGVDISNVPARIPLCNDKVRMTLFNWGATGCTATVYMILSDEP